VDFSKYPIEKFFYFLAGVIPGCVALWVFQVAHPGTFEWLFANAFLGYRTKLAIVGLSSFVTGNSLNSFLNGLLGMMGGIYGRIIGMRPYRPSKSYETAPWRDSRWRSALKAKLGSESPNDTFLMTQELYDLRRLQLDYLPKTQADLGLAQLNLEKLQTEIDDSRWAQWYEHYHRMLYYPTSPDPAWHVARGLAFNLETTALYLLISAVFVPALRKWWCIIPSCIWVLLLIAQEYAGLKRAMDKWETLSDQIKYLSTGGA
jgi:hypothetical protein